MSRFAHFYPENYEARFENFVFVIGESHNYMVDATVNFEGYFYVLTVKAIRGTILHT